MPKNQVIIKFPTIRQLWSFADRIAAVNIEINTNTKTLICDCSEADLKLLEEHGGIVIDESSISRYKLS